MVNRMVLRIFYIASTKLQETANNISQWCMVNKMKINTNKTKEIVINFARSSDHIPTLEINGQEIDKVGQADKSVKTNKKIVYQLVPL